MPGRFVDRRELVETAAAKLEVLDVDLNRLPRDMDLSTAPRPWAVSLQGHPGHAMLFENPVDGGCRDVDLVVPPGRSGSGEDHAGARDGSRGSGQRCAAGW